MIALAGDALPSRYARTLTKFRYGPGVFKVDWALDGPIPWTNADCARAATVHLGGTLAEIAAAEGEVQRGRLPERPYVLLAQQSLFDPEPRAGRDAHGLGLLPRAERIDRRHDRSHRGPGRAVRPRLP